MLGLWYRMIFKGGVGWGIEVASAWVPEKNEKADAWGFSEDGRLREVKWTPWDCIIRQWGSQEEWWWHKIRNCLCASLSRPPSCPASSLPPTCLLPHTPLVQDRDEHPQKQSSDAWEDGRLLLQAVAPLGAGLFLLFVDSINHWINDCYIIKTPAKWGQIKAQGNPADLAWDCGLFPHSVLPSPRDRLTGPAY